jgi:hypothetical protein
MLSTGTFRATTAREWSETLWRQLAVRDSICDHFNREAFSVADSFLASLAVRHYTRQFEGLSDPAAVFFTVQVDRKVHSFIISEVVQRPVGVTTPRGIFS